MTIDFACILITTFSGRKGAKSIVVGGGVKGRRSNKPKIRITLDNLVRFIISPT